MFELTPFFITLLLATGLAAGIINVLAGGGSNLTIPALMVMGLPADMANATNRVGVMLQSLVGLRGFNNSDRLERTDMVPILVPTLLGGAVGAAVASFLPNTLLKPLLLGTMITLSVVMIVKPNTIFPGPDEQPKRIRDTPWAALGLFFTGVYGGFVQAGVGFLLIAALAGGLRYDLVRANALKLLCAGAFTAVSLVIFIAHGLVAWVPGLILGIGTMAGAQIGVRLALNVSQTALKWFLLCMTLAASAAAIWL
ncbi:permease [Saccharospirillum sp. MSK14-1]|uniref:sulfite exporter TauE/SafE family protein n=1 Tax=Saccharospirillum sp. MSK14-1 TaxID=1897632 RepID=UPI000D353A1D|nr:sulfite exporter TauE/SafE family protein [Saccharospirillum sp. MSK14-1]PTY37203.1 permease [Saccharospirillum sp. MSK14-1]